MLYLAQIETATKFIDHAAAQDMRWWFLGLLVVGGAALWVVARYWASRHDRMSERLDKVQDNQYEHLKSSNAQLVTVVADNSATMKKFSETIAAMQHLFEKKAVLVLLFLGLCFTACATRPSAPRFSPPTTSGIRKDTAQARVAVAASKGNVQAAQGKLTAAQDQAASLAAAAPELQAPVQKLQENLTAVSVDLAAAVEQAAGAEAALQVSDQHATELQTQIDQQTGQLNREATEKNQALADLTAAKADARHQTGLAWKWRLIALAEILAVAAFFVARQYFPFLKLI